MPSPNRLAPPGATLVVLRRHKTSTDVLLLATEAGGAPLPCARSRAETTQWDLAEELCEETWANEVSRLYASALSVFHDAAFHGVFVGFLDGDAIDAPLPAMASWTDLREAAATLPEPWAETLGAVREAFVARSPDEALRIR